VKDQYFFNFEYKNLKLIEIKQIRFFHNYSDFRHPSMMVCEIGEIYAEVVTFVAGSLESGGLPVSLEIPEVLK
jgi:hypothetical protein